MGRVMDYFHQICQVPRPSGQEEKMRQRLVNRSEWLWYIYKVDLVGNIVIYVPATPDSISSPTIILQAHMDMVAVKDPWSDHDFSQDPITYYENKWLLYASSTTLGADNGMGMAMMLAYTHEHSHPSLELMFTIDEERGLVGALGFDPSLLRGSYLINLDTEDYGEICISSAGGARIEIVRELQHESNLHTQTLDIELKGLLWGHSWVDIHRKRGNAIVALAQLVSQYNGQRSLHDIQGGQVDNAIPSSCRIVISIESKSSFMRHANRRIETYKSNHDCPDATLKVGRIKHNLLAIQRWNQIIADIAHVPDGIISMSEDIEGLVQTSTNLGIVKISINKILVTHATRSSVMQELDEIVSSLTNYYEKNGYMASVYARYPGWQQSPHDPLVQKTQSAFRKVWWCHPKIVAYHAWLECGAIVQRIGRSIQAVSFGPTIKNPHSTQERVDIETVESSYRVLVELLEDI